MGEKEIEYEQDTLIDFLYKDMYLINSFYSQYFNGKVNSIVKKELSADSSDKEASCGLSNLINGKIRSGKIINESIESNIDPMDVIILDLIEALSIDITNDLTEIPTGKIVAIKGNLIFRDYNVINELLPLILNSNLIPELNASLIPNARGKSKQFTLGKLMQNLVSIIPFGLEFEVITEDNEHITAIIKDEYLTIKPDDLIRTYGLTFPDDWIIIGILDKAPSNQLSSNSELKSGIDAITNYYYETMNENSSGLIIRPIIIYRKIQSN